jgi:hypothetical protein
MTSTALRDQRIRWLEDRVTIEQVEKYIPTLVNQRDREIATSYLVTMEPSGEIAARYGVRTGRIMQIMHKIIRIIQGRVANNVDPADFDPKLRDEREFNYKLKTGMGYSKHVQRPKIAKFLKRTALTREIAEMVYPIIVANVQEAQDGAMNAMWIILKTVDDLDEAKIMLSHVQRDMLAHRDAFGKLAYEDDDQDS